MKRRVYLLLFLVLPAAMYGCSHDDTGPITHLAYSGPLIASRTTMVTAWEFPKNPLVDTTLDDSRLSNDIRWGFRLFTNTPAEAPRFVPGKISCSNCHLNAGQRERALPLIGVAAMFPEYNRRSGRLYTLNDRIVDCFFRSQNATGPVADGKTDKAQDSLPTQTTKEVLALAAYISWLARGYEMGQTLSWRGQNVIDEKNRIAVDKLDSTRGEALFMERCVNCHGQDGQGVAIGEKKAAPLWGPDSWNDGAGAARIYTLAGMIRYMMPYTAPGTLTDEEAQQLAAFINSKPRPAFPFKDQDYLTEKLPVDSVYYPKREDIRP
jgi:thiosulfate dehydrogenase